MRLPRRTAEPAGQLSRGIRRPHTRIQQVRSSVDPLREHVTTSAPTVGRTRHVINVLLNMSHRRTDAPRPFDTPIAQRHLKAEVANCVGGVTSPLLSNIMLDDFDQEFWARGHRFVRYADDIRVFVKSKRAAQRVLEQSTMLLEQRLKLKANRTKSSINPATTAVLLGFGFYFTASGVKIRVAPKAWQRAKARIRALTSRRWSVSMQYRIARLNRYVRGWVGYFRLADTPGKFSDLDEWFRRRMRQIRWKEWKRCRTRVANLRALGSGLIWPGNGA